ncbi:MAG: restriction endonuclease subunit S [Lachnospiraceae bacterium]|nr:restriction endonuclease subunit S [Lachnospiraceae bacterium]
MSRHKLGDLLKIQHGYAFKSDNYVAKSQYRLVTLGNFASGNSFKYNDEKATYYGAEFPEEFILKEGDLIMPMTEQVIGLFGNTAFIPETTDYTFILNQRVGKVIYDEGKVDKYYLHYLLATSSVKQQIEARASGTRQRNISPENIYDVEVDIPDISVQEKIGQFLYLLEEKQIMNNKTIQELEIMAKVIYDYWFLQYDFPNEDGKPYKSSGGKMVWNEELGRKIPEGWKAGNLYEIADFVNGLACQKYRPIHENRKIPVIKIGEMHNGITESTEFVRDDIPEKNIINNGDILFSWSATLETMIWTGGKAGLNQHIFKVIPKYAKYYVFMQLSSYIVNFVKMAEARKTTMGHITTDHIKQSKIALPPESIAVNYSKQVEGIFDKVISNSATNREVVSLRDFLLPLLMNGQVMFSK